MQSGRFWLSQLFGGRLEVGELGSPLLLLDPELGPVLSQVIVLGLSGRGPRLRFIEVLGLEVEAPWDFVGSRFAFFFYHEVFYEHVRVKFPLL